jgi:hypothetical protein
VGRIKKRGPPAVLSGAPPPPPWMQSKPPPRRGPVFDFDAVWDLGIVKIVELA